MALVFGLAASYSPLLYRPRARWPEIGAQLVGDVTQPLSAQLETPECLDGYAQRLNAAFATAAARLAGARIETLIVLVCDRRRLFDDSNTPQLHIFVGDTIWGDPARPEFGEPPARVELACDAELANFLAEELVGAGFDMAESRGAFRPLGDPERGVGAALIEPLRRLGGERMPRIVPIHVNCHVDPCISAHRMAPFGRALSRAAALVPGRVGILASGGLSGEPGGAMAGWVDDVLDRWVLARLRTGRSADTGGLFDIDSMTLRGATREIRLWTAAGAAMEESGRRAKVVEYLPFHHSAVGTAVAVWEEE